MSPEEIIDQLAPIRLPSEFTTFGPVDALVAFAFGILVAIAARAILPTLAVREESPLAMARRKIAALSGLGGHDRLFQLALLFREIAPGRRVGSAALYDPDLAPDPTALEREVLAIARRQRRRE